MPLQQTSGAASYDAFGGGAAAKVNYIEDCFVSWLSTGNGTSRTVTGPDMTTGGLSITKSRSAATGWHFVDTARGAGNSLSSNTTAANASESTGVTAFTATGTSVGAAAEYNTSGATYVDYLLKKQPKFFDVVTYTGNGANQTISHSLGSVPGCIIIKSLSDVNQWHIYHRSLGNNQVIRFSTGAATAANSTYWQTTTPTSTEFYIGSLSAINDTGLSYVAYLFAHNAGGFGLTGTDNVISCGSFTGNTTVNLGYEPQWVLLKRTDGISNWFIFDNMRGLPADVANSNTRALFPNVTSAESATDSLSINSTGFTGNLGAVNYIYVAIRRGPMKVPTSGTSVFAPITGTTDANFGFPADFVIFKNRAGTSGQPFFTRLLDYKYLNSSNTFAEGGSSGDAVWNASQTTFSQALTGASSIFEGFRRAPSFFDVVCYTTPGSTFQVVTHNLGVTPELIIVKQRNNTNDWGVQYVPFGSNSAFYLNTADAVGAGGWSYFFTSVTASSITATTSVSGYAAGTYVAYLFATCAGVSKVGSFTGNGTSQTIPCGFTSGARFVLIKKSSGTGDWMVSDSARGIVAGSDPYLELNNTNAEVAGEDWLDTDSTGFVVNEVSGSNANTSGATYIFLAIA